MAKMTKTMSISVQALATTLLCIPGLISQSIISGDITGTVTDPSAASLPNAEVTLQNAGTGATQTVATNTQGVYRFAFIPPGTYSVAVSASGFRNARQTHLQVVAAGQSTTADFQLVLAAATETVDVTEHAAGVQTENADTVTNYSADRILDIPNPGGDLTYIAQTAPGIVMNTQSGYGNFSANGLPGTSNLFSVNGQNFNDPFLSLNNSGASNLLLGSNDVAEANVITNAYSGQYGQYAGAQVTYITKSGNNEFHGDGDLDVEWPRSERGRLLQQLGGISPSFRQLQSMGHECGRAHPEEPYVLRRGLRGRAGVLPTATSLILAPSPQFQAATLANLAAVGNSAEIPFYKQLFAVYNGAPNIGSAVPATTPNGGCGNFTLLAAGVPCADQFRATSPNKLSEYQWSSRVDHNISDRDHAYLRVYRDNGFQPTFTSPFGPTFNDQSTQPQMSAQLAENHTFNSTTVNQINVSALFTSATFVPANAPHRTRRCRPRWRLPAASSPRPTSSLSSFRKGAVYFSIRLSTTFPRS
jgi:hypothetical protein